MLIGIRNLDEREKEIVRASGVRVFTMKDIDRGGIATVIEQALAIAGDGTSGMHVSFDLDVCDPAIAPGVGTPVKGGLDYREAHMLMEIVADSGLLRALDLVEVNPILDDRNMTADPRRRARRVGARSEDSASAFSFASARPRRPGILSLDRLDHLLQRFDQHHQRERLEDQPRVRPDLLQPAGLLRHRREDHDRRRRRNGQDDLAPRALRQPQIDHRAADAALLQALLRGLGGIGGDDVEALQRQELFERSADAEVVLDDENQWARHFFFAVLDRELRLRPPEVVFRLADLRVPFASPDCRRCLFTVAAAISFARFVLRPDFFADSLMCSY